MTKNMRIVKKKNTAIVIVFSLLLSACLSLGGYIYFSLHSGEKEMLSQQQQLKEEVDKKWQKDSSATTKSSYDDIVSSATGEPIAIMRIPAMDGLTVKGKWEFVVVKGTTIKDISVSPGWYSDTQLPGEKGNFSVAAHESGYGAPFEEIWYHMSTCDEVFVETVDTVYTYKIVPKDGSKQEKEKFASCAPNVYKKWEDFYEKLDTPMYANQVITPNQSELFNPVPMTDKVYDDSSILPLITLQTCYPHLDNSHRVGVRGILTETKEKNK